MAKFLTKTLLFGLLIVLCCYGVELALLYSPSDYQIKREKLTSNPEGISTLILGHSQLYHGLNPDLMGDSVFNCASPLQAPYYSYELLRSRLPDMTNLKCVILPLCDFYDDMSGKTSGYSSNGYNNYVKCMSAKYFDIPPLNANKFIYWWELKWSHWEGPAFLRIINAKKTNCNPNGYVPRTGQVPSDIAQKKNIQISNELTLKPNEIEGIKYSKLIAGVCRDHGIRLIYLRTPCTAEHLHCVGPHKQFAMSEFLRAIRQVNPDVEYYDYSSYQGMLPADFHDETHLNDQGATKFSQIVKTEVLERKWTN